MPRIEIVDVLTLLIEVHVGHVIRYEDEGDKAMWEIMSNVSVTRRHGP